MHSGRLTMRRVILVAVRSVPSEPTKPQQVVARGVKMFTADVDESRGSAGAGIGAVDEGSVVPLVLG